VRVWVLTQVRASSRTPTSIDLLHMRRSDFDKVTNNTYFLYFSIQVYSVNRIR
jgi:hypothetical protein